ncbi:hypothetical protein MesoLjLa_60420 [Mesorhizobium sp. L-2-11]|nr:hypothetical protein MesoLjLa_60420 [Mesorhizobium sp. L-2-11]
MAYPIAYRTSDQLAAELPVGVVTQQLRVKSPNTRIALVEDTIEAPHLAN